MLPIPWVHKLFSRLGVRYADALVRKYEGFEMEAVHLDWSQQLAGVSGEAIDYALNHLPATFPPNAAEFRALCLAMPSLKPKALPAPASDPKIRQRGIDKLKSLRFGQGHPKAWIWRLQERMEKGEKLNQGQRFMLKHALMHSPEEQSAEEQPDGEMR